MNTLLTLLFTLLAIPTYRMMVISDPHVLDQSLFNVNSASMQAKMANDLDQSEYSQAVFNQLIDKALTDKPDVVLIPGDMTKNGSRVSHDAVAAQLHRLTDANIKVCLIPGNHDINNSNAVSYLGETTQSVPSISSAEFDSIYAFTKQAFPNRREDPNSHSYVLTLAPRLTLIGADCTADYYTSGSGVFKSSTLQWICAQADSATLKGDRVIAMMHYQLLEHTDEFGTLVPQALVENYEIIAQVFRAHGIELVLTGHMHYSNVSTNYITASRDSLVEISSGSAAMYPNPYRMITVSGERDQFSCITNYITSLAGNSTFSPDNNKQHVVDVIQNVKLRELYDVAWEYRDSVGPMIDQIQIKDNINGILEFFKIGKSNIRDLAIDLVGAIPGDSKERATYINGFIGADASTAAIIHFEGNEGNVNTESLKKNLIKDVYNLLVDLIENAYPGKDNKSTRNKWLERADLIYRGVSPYESVPLKLILFKSTLQEAKDKIQDFLDGFFGDYTRYKKDDQNRTDDLRPNLRFAQLTHRDYYATVTFDLMGYGDNFVQKVLINDPNKISRPKDPSADGMYFVNWYSDPELTQLYDFNTEIISDDDVSITLYAKFIHIITFTLGDVKKMYDGTPVAPLYKYKGSLPKSCKEQVEVDTIITNVDSVTYRVTGTTIWKGTENVTANYHIEWSQDAASMVITPRTIAITTGSASGTYNGVALTSNDTTMSGDGFVAGQGINITYTGTQTLVGNSDNTIIYTAQEGTLLDNYTINVTPGKLTITPASIAIALRDTTKMYDGQPMTVTYDVVGTLINDDELLLTIDNESITDADAQEAVITNVQIMNAAKEDHTDQYAIVITDSVATLEVTQRSVEITTASATKIYDGTPLTMDSLTITGDGFIEGEGLDITVTGTQTFVGESNNTITFEAKDGTNLENYDLVEYPGTLSITTAALSIAMRDSSKMYDGDTLRADYILEGNLAAGDEVKVYLSNNEIVDAGTTITNLDSVVILNALAENVTAQYTITYTKESATLIILPREITIGSASASKVYDGTALTKDSVWIDGEFAQGEGLTVHATGSQMYVGTSANTIDYTANEGTLLENYVITIDPGQLEVTPAELSLSLKDASKMYDGDTLRAEYTLEGNLAAGDEVKVYLSNNEIVNADTVTAILDSVVILNAANENVTNQYTITPTKSEATLIITPRSIEITTGSASGIYNGVALTNQDTTMVGDGFVEGEGVAVTFTGTVTKVDTVANTMTYEALEGTNLANYVITIKTGSLVITQRPLTINMDADLSKMYDGIALEATYQVDGELATGDSLTVTIENGTRTNAGTDTAAITYLSIKNAALEDVTSQYAISSNKIMQTLEITKRSIEITTASAEKEYDGEELVADSMMLTAGDGFVEGEGIVVTSWGSQIEEGSSMNSIEYVAQEGTTLDNYEITIIEGTLTVTSKAIIPTELYSPSEVEQVEKVIINNQLYIRKGGVLYDATGKRVNQ